MSGCARYSDINNFSQEFIAAEIDFVGKDVLINTNDLLHLAVLLAWTETTEGREVNTSFIMDLNKSISMNRYVSIRSLGFSFNNQDQEVVVEPMGAHTSKENLYSFIDHLFSISDSKTYHGITMEGLINALKQAKEAEPIEYKFKERSTNIGGGKDVFQFRYDEDDSSKNCYIVSNQSSFLGFFNELTIVKTDDTTVNLTLVMDTRTYRDPTSVIPKQIIQLTPKDAEGFTQIRFLSPSCYFHHYGKEDDKEINYFDLR